MRKSTRRLVFLAVLIVLLTVPAEVLLLRAIAVPDQNTAIRNWAESLESRSLQQAVARIQTYPVVYRREIMRVLTPEQRAATWRAHIADYLQSRPTLDVNAVDLIRAIHDALTPSLFDRPSDADREKVRALAEQIEAHIGQTEADYLMKHLGPLDGTFAAYEPWTMAITNRLRTLFVGVAQSNDCDCIPMEQCYGYAAHCSDAVGCNYYYGPWPACGWFWTDPCTGKCLLGW